MMDIIDKEAGEQLAKLQKEEVELDEEVKVGDNVHLGFGAKGGTGFKGKVIKIDGNNVHIKNPKGKEYKGPMKFVTKEEVELDEVKVKGTNVGGIGVKGKGLPGSSARYKLPKGRPRGAPHIENERFWDLPKSQLNYIRKDAYDAMKANPTARKASGKWADEVNDAETVLYWRKKKGIKEEVELDNEKQELQKFTKEFNKAYLSFRQKLRGISG